MKIKTYASTGSRYSSLYALGLCLLWVFATTLPVLAQGDKATQLMAGERLGGIKLEMAEKHLTDLLGQPKEKGELKFQGGTGEYHQTWLYPDKGLEITLSAGESETGAKTVKFLYRFERMRPGDSQRHQDRQLGSGRA